MDNLINERSERLISNWWLSLIVGIVAIAVGFIVMVNPTTSYYTFALWLGVVVFISGIAGLLQSLTSWNYFVRRGWIVMASVADLIIGLMLMLNALLSAVVLPIVLGCWLLYRGIVMLMQGVDLRSSSVRDAGWVIFYATLIVILAIAILWMPTTLGVEAVILFVAIAFIAYGISAVSLAFRLGEVHRRAKELQ